MATKEASSNQLPKEVVPLALSESIWERTFIVAPLVLIGSKSADGDYNIAPKHMAAPMGWEDYYGFVCAPTHTTHENITESRQFTVSFPRPNLLLESSLAASPREADDQKPGLAGIPTFPAQHVDGVCVRGCYFFLECELDRTVEDLGKNSLIIGRIVAAAVDRQALRDDEIDDADLIYRNPLLAYLHPGRIAEIRQTGSFPFHAGFSR